MQGLARKPLTEREVKATKAVVTVTGAESYIGSAVIQRLLAAGHFVRGSWRGKDPTTVQHLFAFQNASTNLQLFAADLMVPGSFSKALQGARYLIHVASPCNMNPPKGKGYELLVEPALVGVDNVLNTALDVPTLEKVVITSSVAAVAGSCEAKPPGHLYSERDWNRVATNHYLPYNRSKTAAEQRAYKFCGKSECHWKLATICPGIVQGPPTGKIKCESTEFMAKLLGGFYYPFGCNVGLPLVDVDDVAAAHVLAMVTPEAVGRFIVCSTSMLLSNYVDLLRPGCPQPCRLPYLWLPFWLLWFLTTFRVVDKEVDLELLARIHNTCPLFSTDKTKRVLGLDYLDVRRTVKDMMQAVVGLGYVS